MTPIRKDFCNYLEDDELYKLKTKLNVELKVLTMLGKYKVADADSIALLRENGEYLFTDLSARFYANKHARTLFDEELVDIYTVKKENSNGRGDNIYTINENGYRLLGLDCHPEIQMSDIPMLLEITHYVLFRCEQLLSNGYGITDTIDLEGKAMLIKYHDNDNMYNEYVIYDDYDIHTVINKCNDYNNYNAIYTVLCKNVYRGKEIIQNNSQYKLRPVVTYEVFEVVYKRNTRNQKTPRPIIKFKNDR